MKILLCADVRLGAICTENLEVKLSHKWQAARTKKLSELIDQAAQNNAFYVALYGQMFGQERVSETVIDSLFQAVKEDAQIQVLAFLMAEEYNRISYRNDVPENLHLICLQTKDTYVDDRLALRIEKGKTELQLSDNDSVWISYVDDKGYVISGIGEDKVIPTFEPIGFEDAMDTDTGYGIIEWSEEEILGYSYVEDQRYTFRSTELKILPEDGQKDIVRKINSAVSKLDPDTFLRITIVGKSAFGLILNGDAMEKHLQTKIFFAEVYDNSIMDIDEEAFVNDISLRSEFVRLALNDDSLSESERNRLISCGWNALNGKEVSAE